MASARYCDSCGEKIEAEAIESGAALAYEGAYYCAECKQDVLPLIGKQEKQSKAKKTAATAVTEKTATAVAAKAKPSGSAPGKKVRRTAARARRPGAGAPAAADKSASARGRSTAKPVGKTPAGAAKSARDPSGEAGARKRVKRRARAATPATEREEEPKAQAGAARGKHGKVVKRKKRVRTSRSSSGGRSRSRRRSSGSGELEAAAGKRGGPPWLWIGLGAAALVLIAAIALMNGGDDTADTSAGGDAVQLAAETQADKDAAAKALFEETKKAIGDPPEHGFSAAIEQWSRVRADMTAEWAKKVDAEIERLRVAKRDAARAALEALTKKAKDLEAQGDIVAALDVWSTAPQDLRSNADWEKLARPEIRRLEKAVMARLEAMPLLERAEELASKGEIERAIGVLEGFDLETYRGTEWASRLEARLRELATGGDKAAKQAAIAEIEAAEQAEKARLAAERTARKQKDLARVANERWEGQGVDLFIWKLPEPSPKEAWKTEGKELVCRAPASAQGEFAAIAGVGKPTWSDYLVKFDYKIERGKLAVGVRSNGRAFVKLDPKLKADGNWHTITILVYGDGDDAFEEVLPDGTRRRLGFDAHDSWTGGIAFAVSPGGEVRLRDIKVKVIHDERSR